MLRSFKSKETLTCPWKGIFPHSICLKSKWEVSMDYMQFLLIIVAIAIQIIRPDDQLTGKEDKFQFKLCAWRWFTPYIQETIFAEKFSN